jgi:hypothetical protein
MANTKVSSEQIIDGLALGGNPTAATQTAGNNSTRIATTAYTDAAVTALIGGAPSTLDTLNEIAAAVSDDPDYVGTVNAALALKAPKASPTFTGTVTTAAISGTTGTFSGEITANGGIALGDSDKATFGASDDLQIYHDGSHSYVGDYGTGNLSVTGNNLYLQNTAGETYFSGISDGAVSLYHNNLAKLATTSTGIDVTGTATMDGLLVGGNLDITSEYPRINLTDTNSNPDWSIINANGIINFYDQTNATNPLKVKATGIDVTGAVNSTGEMRITNPSATSQLYLYGAAGQKANIILNEYGVRAWHLGAGTYTSGNFSISDGSTERLVINSSGFVGIGADPLNAKVDIARESDYTSHTGHGLAIHSSGNTAYTSLYVGTDDTIDCAYIQTAGRNTSFTSKSLLLNPNGGNVLVGKTAANFTVAGHEIKPNSFAGFTRDGGAPVVVNRLTNDGALLEFYRGTQSVGSVGSRIGTGITIDSGGSTDGLLKNNGAESFGWNANYFYPRTDNSKDLGLDVLRWKDLYLSGGVYLGGTGAANKLDDFESGTWFPNFDEQTAGTGTYTKVGRLVTVQGQVTCDANGGATGALAMSGLPFSVGVSNSLRLIVSMTNVNASAGGSGVASPFNGMTFNMHDQYVRATSTGGNPYYSYNLLKIGTVVRISGSFVTS